MRSFPVTGWRAEAVGAARTTHAGRLALPVAIKLGDYVIAVVDLILDGQAADQVCQALTAHLSGTGATAVAQ